MTNWNNGSLRSTNEDLELDEVEDTDAEVITGAEETAAETSASPKRRARRSASGGDRLTRGQVATVLDTFDDVKKASPEALVILRTVLRDSEADHEVLTGLILTADRADNPLATLAELQESLAQNPFAVAATIAGMPPAVRNRAFTALQAATGADEVLSKKDVEAATVFGGALTALTDDQKLALEEALELIGK